MNKLHVKKYLEYLEFVKGASPHTIRNYSMDLKLLENFLQGKKVTSKSLREFLASMHQAGKSKSSIARTLSAIKAFYAFIFRQKLIKSNPALFLQTPKRTRKIPIILELEEIKLFMQTPNASNYLGFRDKVILELFYSSGIRLSELVSLDKENVNLKEKWIKVLGKGNKERLVPITSRCGKYLGEYLMHKDRIRGSNKHLEEFDKKAVFLNRFGERISSRSVDRMFVSYQKRSGIAKKITPHLLRHSIATHLLDKGMDLRYIQEMLGHTTIATTTIYTKVTSELKSKNYKKYHPFS